MTDLTPPGSPTFPPRLSLLLAAHQIAANNDRLPSSPLKALSKLFLAPRWEGQGQRAKGLRRWKQGELIEFASAALKRDWAGAREELGDCGYYAAQGWDWCWWLYSALVPGGIIEKAVAKFQRRAQGGR